MNVKSILEEGTVSKRFLFPRGKKFQNPFLVKTPQNNLSCYRQFNHPGRKMLMVFHGTSEIVTDYLEGFSYQIDQMGYNLFVAEYPGYSFSTGKPSLINIIEEIPYFITGCGVPPGELIVFGRSLGSAYAVNAISMFPEIRGLIIESGIADFYEKLNKRVSPEDIDTTEGNLREEVERFFHIEDKLKTYTGSTLIMHTREDRIINVKHALQNYEWANEPKKLLVFDEGDHGDIQFCNRQEYFGAIKEIMDTC